MLGKISGKLSVSVNRITRSVMRIRVCGLVTTDHTGSVHHSTEYLRVLTIPLQNPCGTVTLHHLPQGYLVSFTFGRDFACSATPAGYRYIEYRSPFSHTTRIRSIYSREL